MREKKIVIVGVVGDENNSDIVAIAQKNGSGAQCCFLSNNIHRVVQSLCRVDGILVVDDETFERIIVNQRLVKVLIRCKIIVLSRKIEYTIKRSKGRMLDAITVNSFKDAVENAQHGSTIFIIGNVWLYQLAMLYAHCLDIIHITKLGERISDEFWGIPVREWQQQSYVGYSAQVETRKYEYIHVKYTPRKPRLDPLVNSGATQYVYPGNATNGTELALIEKYQRQGICPFCDGLPDHSNEIYEVGNFRRTKRMWSDGIDELVYPKSHVDHTRFLTDEEKLEFFRLIEEVEVSYGIGGSETTIYSGKITDHSSAIAHVHARIRVPEKKAEDVSPKRSNIICS